MASFNMLLLLALLGHLITFAAGIPVLGGFPVQGRAPGADVSCRLSPFCLHAPTATNNIGLAETATSNSALVEDVKLEATPCATGNGPHNDLCFRHIREWDISINLDLQIFSPL